MGEIYLYMAKIALEIHKLEVAKLRLMQAGASCKKWRWGDVLQQLLRGRFFLADKQTEEAISCFKMHRNRRWKWGLPGSLWTLINYYLWPISELEIKSWQSMNTAATNLYISGLPELFAVWIIV
ncbi:hypothetical protein [Iodobacter ciconiae]|nr:hypothetical protein [Iodobacter ciconiae]